MFELDLLMLWLLLMFGYVLRVERKTFKFKGIEEIT